MLWQMEEKKVFFLKKRRIKSLKTEMHLDEWQCYESTRPTMDRKCDRLTTNCHAHSSIDRPQTTAHPRLRDDA